MLSRLLRWFGIGSTGGSIQRSTAPPRGPRPRSATAHLFDKRSTTGKPQAAAKADGDFNPYNTGKFDRSASWERISKNQR